MSTFELSISSKDLRAVMARAGGAANARSTMPILACCLLEATADKLTVSTTDSFCTEQSSATAAVKREGALCVDARNFADMVKQLPAGDVTLKQSGTGLELKCGKVRYKLPSMPGEDFPPMPVTDNATPVVSLASTALSALLASAAYAMSTDDSRPHLNGVLLELAGDVLTAVSTDGHRLALAKLHTPHGPATKLLMPAKGVAELKKLCASADQVTIKRSGKLLLLTTDDTTVVLTGADETFPPYAKVIPSSFAIRAQLSRELLSDALKRVSLVAGKTTGSGIRLELKPGELSISAESAEAGEAHESLECDVAGELTIGCHAGYLLQALSALSSDDVTLELGGNLDPIVVKAVGDDSTLGVCMPMRI